MNDTPVRVLLVDDDEDDFVITRDLISRIDGQRYHLDWVDNYEAALESVARQEHDLYLLDYRLGERTGLDLLRQVQGSPGRAPMILLTGQGDHEVDVEAMRAGAADYLIKGQLSADVLDRAIRYAIERKRAEDTLRRERDLISRIMATSPVGILTVGSSGAITFANTQAEQVLGLDRETIAAGTCHIRDWRFTDLDGNRSAPLREALNSGQPVQGARYAIECSNGRRVMVSINATPLLRDAGNVDGLVVTLEAITERLNLEAQLRQSQKMESVGQLAAGVAHDINNVLTIILGHVGLLMAVTKPDSPAVKSLWQISAATERAARFIRQLLMFSRRQVIQSTVLELNAVLRNLGSMLPRLLGEDVALDAHYAPDLPRIEADVGMIEQIVMNLAVNARDAMPKGGKLQIATSAVDIDAAYVRKHSEARPGRFVCLKVADTGCGMDRSVLGRIFEPFFSTKEVGRGTGLGLATVYGIVKQHHGWLEVDSELGVGSVFRIYFPATSKSVEADQGPVFQLEAVRGGKETILLVEDETLLRELVVTVLLEYGYQVLEAASGAEALRIWEQHAGRIDLLLTDIVMPGGMNGFELAAQLKQRAPDLKVICSSGYNADTKGRETGQNGHLFLPKPYLPRQLAQLVRKSLDTVPNAKRGPLAASAAVDESNPNPRTRGSTRDGVPDAKICAA